VQCAGMTFTHQTGDDNNEFISDGEDLVTVTLTEDERSHLVRRVRILGRAVMAAMR
jgi:Trp operon repressor